MAGGCADQPGDPLEQAMTIVLLAVGAMTGAPARYLTDRLVQPRPWGTFAVNVVASLLMGLLLGLKVSPAVMALAGSGLCGALSTYSTFSYETLRVAQAGAPLRAGLNIVASIGAGLAAAYLGLAIGAAIRPLWTCG
jgi:CrcB protein